MNAAHGLLEGFFKLSGVITQAVVSAIGHNCINGFGLEGEVAQRMLTEFFFNLLGRKLPRGNWPDDAIAVAGGHKVSRDAAREHEALLNGLVAIAVAECKFSLADTRGHDGAVGAGGAVNHRVAAMSAEDAGCKDLCLTDRAGMVEERSELNALDPGVGRKRFSP